MLSTRKYLTLLYSDSATICAEPHLQEQEVIDLFASAGFVCTGIRTEARGVENRKRDIHMDRRWIQV